MFGRIGWLFLEVRGRGCLLMMLDILLTPWWLSFGGRLRYDTYLNILLDCYAEDQTTVDTELFLEVD